MSSRPFVRKFNDDVESVSETPSSLDEKFDQLDGSVSHEKASSLISEIHSFLRPSADEHVSLFKLRFNEISSKVIDHLKEPLEGLMQEMSLFLKMAPTTVSVNDSPYFKQQIVLTYEQVLMTEESLREVSEKFWFWDRKYNTLTDFRLLKTLSKTTTLIIALAYSYDQ